MEDKDFILTLIISHISKDITEEENDLLEQLMEEKEVQDLYNKTYDLLMSEEAMQGRAELSNYAPVLIKKHPVRKFFDRYYIGLSLAAMVIIIVAIYIAKPHSIINTSKSKVVLPSSDSIQLVLNNGKILDMGSYDTIVTGTDNKQRAGTHTYYLGKNAGQSGTLQIPPGRFYYLILSDGTLVKISAGTTITFPLVFDGPREIGVSGEADIEVVKNAGMPFSVRLPKSVANVLGTRFIASSRDGKEGISVITGKVQYVKGEDSVLLNKGEEAYTQSDSSLKKSSFDVNEKLKETNTYDSISMEQLADLIYKHFRMEVKFSRLEPNRKFFCSLNYNESIQNFMARLKRISGVQYRITGNTIQIN